MFRQTLLTLALLFGTTLIVGASTSGSRASTSEGYGEYTVINTGGFVEKDGVRSLIDPEPDIAHVLLSPLGEQSENVLVEINGTRIEVHALKNGLASFYWDPEDTHLVHRKDILDLSGKDSLEQVPAWGSRVVWPKLGTVTFVLFRFDKGTYGGFLVSKPGKDRTIVRQMEFHKASGPRHRADNLYSYGTPEHRR